MIGVVVVDDERMNDELVPVLGFIVKFLNMRDNGGGGDGRMVVKEKEKEKE
jgi:hypothetical protein